MKIIALFCLGDIPESLFIFQQAQLALKTKGDVSFRGEP